MKRCIILDKNYEDSFTRRFFYDGTYVQSIKIRNALQKGLGHIQNINFLPIVKGTEWKKFQGVENKHDVGGVLQYLLVENG